MGTIDVNGAVYSGDIFEIASGQLLVSEFQGVGKQRQLVQTASATVTSPVTITVREPVHEVHWDSSVACKLVSPPPAAR